MPPGLRFSCEIVLTPELAPEYGFPAIVYLTSLAEEKTHVATDQTRFPEEHFHRRTGLFCQPSRREVSFCGGEARGRRYLSSQNLRRHPSHGRAARTPCLRLVSRASGTRDSRRHLRSRFEALRFQWIPQRRSQRDSSARSSHHPLSRRQFRFRIQLA